MSISPDGSLLVSGGRDGKIVLTSLLNPSKCTTDDLVTDLPATEQKKPLSREGNLASIVKKRNSIAKKSRRSRAKRKSIDVSMGEHLGTNHTVDPLAEDINSLEPNVTDVSHEPKQEAIAEVGHDINEELTEIEKELFLNSPFSPFSADSGMTDSNEFSFIDSSVVLSDDESEKIKKQHKKSKEAYCALYA